MAWKFLLRGGCALLLLSFLSCNQSDSWQISRIETGTPKFDSSKLTYHSPDRSNGIDLEMLHTHQSLHFYLQVHSQTIPAYQGNPKEALVNITIGETKHALVAPRHEGGQRLLLPDSAHDIIITALKANQPIKIELEGYSASIDPAQFSEYFNEMQHPSLFRLPTDLF